MPDPISDPISDIIKVAEGAGDSTIVEALYRWSVTETGREVLAQSSAQSSALAVRPRPNIFVVGKGPPPRQAPAPQPKVSLSSRLDDLFERFAPVCEVPDIE